MSVPLVTGTDSAAPGQVRQLFNPRSIALIGATDKSRWSWNIFGNLRLHGFAGPVYLVNPRGVQVHGQRSYARVGDLPGTVDLAFVMVPTSAVLGVLAQAADRGTRTAGRGTRPPARPDHPRPQRVRVRCGT